MSQALTFQVSTTSEGLLVRCTGSISERMSMEIQKLSTVLAGDELIFDCRAIAQINSIGVTLWARYLTGLAKTKAVTFREVSVSYADYVVTVGPMQKIGPIESFYVPMSCPECDRESEERFETAKLVELEPPRPCSACGGPLSHISDFDTMREVMSETLLLRKFRVLGSDRR